MSFPNHSLAAITCEAKTGPGKLAPVLDKPKDPMKTCASSLPSILTVNLHEKKYP